MLPSRRGLTALAATAAAITATALTATPAHAAAAGPSSRMEAWLTSSGTAGSAHAGSCSSVTARAAGGLTRETGRMSAAASAPARKDLLKYRCRQ